ncbi:MAG TPA: hypothetical protein VHQ47_13700 [Phycisphaerae bacterium]|nr:hypothetical protein [Phycisphaerae bacterium]
MEFRWNDWNIDHATKHGVSVAEIEFLITTARPPFPEYRGDGRWLVQGPGFGGRYIQSIHVVDAEGSLYVIHARPLMDSEKRRYRRRR